MSTSDKNCKDGASKSNDVDGVCEVNDMLQKMNTADNNSKEDISVCANCGKEGTDINNICNKCEQVKYCNAACKKKHRHKHKKDCEEHVRLVAEKHNEKLRLAAELHDEKLFKQPPPGEDCPICFLQIPTLDTGRRYNANCGKVICSGCCHAPVYDNQGNEVAEKKCLFCRTPSPKTVEEQIERCKVRVKAGDAEAIYNTGICYQNGEDGFLQDHEKVLECYQRAGEIGLHGFPQDYTKALELFHRSGELGYDRSYNNIGFAYDNGRGVAVDEKKAHHFYELAAMRGYVIARYNLGNTEARAGNVDRAIKHYIIATRCGHTDSLERIKLLYSDVHATKGDYTEALQSYQAYLSEIKSPQRDKAAAFNSKKYRYY